MEQIYKAEKLLPVYKLALQCLGMAVLAGLSFFFHVVAFVTVLLALAYKVNEFKFVYENTKGFPYDSNDSERTIPIPRYQQPTLWDGMDRDEPYGTEMGSDWERSIRAYLPESKG
jgi:hypothetical protein